VAAGRRDGRRVRGRPRRRTIGARRKRGGGGQARQRAAAAAKRVRVACGAAESGAALVVVALVVAARLHNDAVDALSRHSPSGEQLRARREERPCLRNGSRVRNG